MEMKVKVRVRTRGHLRVPIVSRPSETSRTLFLEEHSVIKLCSSIVDTNVLTRVETLSKIQTLAKVPTYGARQVSGKIQIQWSRQTLDNSYNLLSMKIFGKSQDKIGQALRSLLGKVQHTEISIQNYQ